MPYKVVYFDEVKQDIKEAKDWYRLQLKGLEKRFAQDIKRAILRLKERPTVHAIRYKTFTSPTLIYFHTQFIFTLKNIPAPLL
jgi:hypothetical protein